MRLGLDTDALLARVGLNRELLQDPDYPVPVDRVRALLEATSRMPGAESFGLRLGARRRLANLGTIGLVMREEPTGLAALQTLCRYLQLVIPSLYIAIDEMEKVTIIREDLVFAHTTQVRQSIDMALAVMAGILSELLGPSWKAQSVHFSHRAPADLQFHRRIFKCPLHFNAEIQRHRLYLSRPSAATTGTAMRNWADLFRPAWTKPWLGTQLAVGVRVQAHHGPAAAGALQCKPGGKPPAREQPHPSPQLAQEGQSFSGLLIAGAP